MGDPRGFIKHKRHKTDYRPSCERVKDYKDVVVPRPEEKSKEQALRCMDCGVPFCHWACPVGNYIPEWNDFTHQGHWDKALKLLIATNSLPEITGRVCPATCEYGCVLGINDDPVTIRENELAIIEYGFKNGLIFPQPPKVRTGKKVAVIGSGPAGLACADQLNKAGHDVTVFEKDEKAGGILRYGIPDFKLEKHILNRRLDILTKEGITFKPNTHITQYAALGTQYASFDAVCLAIGSRVPRDLNLPGRELKGIHFAMDYLIQSNKRVSGAKIPKDQLVDAKGKKVVVIGGGDTGADCVGTAHRQAASCVIQIEVLEQPPECRPGHQPWPVYPRLLKTSSSHEEGADRHWAVLTKRFLGESGHVHKLSCVKVEFVNAVRSTQYAVRTQACSVMKEIPNSEFEIEADLVILAVGFLHPQHTGLVKDLGLQLDGRGNIKTNPNFQTSQKGIFTAGDCHRGQSLVVWAIAEGRRAAYNIDTFLMGESKLPAL
ncbi:MAG: glutamate synthase subunit beta [Candidatus Omnitrophica bacterium]|nr:glutamate synthase subunit beta [Candidatus Omnitrophota bacterium]